MSEPYTADIRMIQGMQFDARTLSGHEMGLDSGADAAGGGNAGSRPTELILVALGSCTAMDVLSILRKMRQQVSSYDVHVEGDRAEAHPRVFTQIRVFHRLRGEALAEANVARAIQLSITRYCPIYAMLSPAVPIEMAYEVTDAATGAISTGEVQPEAASA